MSITGTPPHSVGTAHAFPAIYRLLLTRMRSLGLGALSGLSLVLALVARGADDPLDSATAAMAGFGLGLVVPVCTLWIASGLIGDLIEDRLLAYLWLKPIPMWVVPAGAMAATATIMVPLVVVPLTVAAAISNDSGLVTATLAASLVGVAGYAGLFVALSTRFSRALWFGLAYILVWENAVARISNGTARLAIRSYLLSMLKRATDIDVPLADRAVWSSYTVPLAIGVVGVGLATWILSRRDID
jgi:ABC-2 type transport system permease protein